MSEQLVAEIDRPLIVWRCSLAYAGAQYAKIVRELTVSASAISRKRRICTGGALFSLMASLGGNWHQASDETLTSLEAGYEGLGLKFALARIRHTTADTKKPSNSPDLKAENGNYIERYLSPPIEVYQTDEMYNQGVDLIQSGEPENALRCLSRACQTYKKLGGIHELHVADCLLNMSTAAAHLGKLGQAVACATQAHLIYERWTRLPETAKAMLNRIGVLCLQGKNALARRLASDCEEVATRARIDTMAVDARAARLASEAGVNPRSQILSELTKLECYYANGCDPFRRLAYEQCCTLSRERLELAIARQMVTLILRQAVRKGLPDGFEPLKKTLQRCPRATEVLIETSFLELSAKAWPVLAEAAVYVTMWLEAGTIEYGQQTGENVEEATCFNSLEWLIEKLTSLEQSLRFWMDDKPLDKSTLRGMRPSDVICPMPKNISLDAARRCASLAGKWEEHWIDEKKELDCLSQVYARAAISSATSHRIPTAKTLVAAAEDCNPTAATLIRKLALLSKNRAAMRISIVQKDGGQEDIFPTSTLRDRFVKGESP